VAKGIAICLMAQVGLGQHLWNLSDFQIEQYFKVSPPTYQKVLLPRLITANSASTLLSSCTTPRWGR
jgi:hypothetical protein